MPQDISLLDRVVIASPCTASWAGMKGDERVRFCELCQLNVYNFSAMSRDEAERLIIEKEGKLCATIYQRRDGTILTRDCPIGLRAIRKGLGRCMAALGAAACLVVSAGLYLTGTRNSITRLRNTEPFRYLCDWIDPPFIVGKPLGTSQIRLSGEVSIPPPDAKVMGDVRVPVQSTSGNVSTLE